MKKCVGWHDKYGSRRRTDWDEAIAILTEIYREYGPGTLSGNGKMPMKEYAALTPSAIDAQWDFDGRHRAHRIARLVVHIKNDAHDRP